MTTRFIGILFVISLLTSKVSGQNLNNTIPPFSIDVASKFSNLVYSCISEEYPNRIDYILESDSDISSPFSLHPVFYGCNDWFTSVNGYWLLIKLLQKFPELPQREQYVRVIEKNLTEKNLKIELDFFKRTGISGFEQPYGWAWYLKLTADLATSDNALHKKWYRLLMPVANVIKEHYYAYLPGLYYPIRKGVYENSALGLLFALDFARATGDKEFEMFLIERAKFYFQNDRNIPASWEPEGEDFLSPSLIEANLMIKVLNKEEFIRWFKDFMPQIPYSLIYPAIVADQRNPNGENLDGLNLSRAWCMFELAKILPDDSQSHRDLWQAGYRHAAEALPNILTDNYTGTHWLACYAVFMYLSLENVQQ